MESKITSSKKGVGAATLSQSTGIPKVKSVTLANNVKHDKGGVNRCGGAHNLNSNRINKPQLNQVSKVDLISSRKETSCVGKIDARASKIVGGKSKTLYGVGHKDSAEKERAVLIDAANKGMRKFIKHVIQNRAHLLSIDNSQQLSNKFDVLAKYDRVSPGYWIAEICREHLLKMGETSREEFAKNLRNFAKNILEGSNDLGEEYKQFVAMVKYVVAEEADNYGSARGLLGLARLHRALRSGHQQEINALRQNYDELLEDDNGILNRVFYDNEVLGREKQTLHLKVSNLLSKKKDAVQKKEELKPICESVPKMALSRRNLEQAHASKRVKRAGVGEMSPQLNYKEAVRKVLEVPNTASSIGGFVSITSIVLIGAVLGVDLSRTILRGDDDANYITVRNIGGFLLAAFLISFIYHRVFVYPRVKHLNHLARRDDAGK